MPSFETGDLSDSGENIRLSYEELRERRQELFNVIRRELPEMHRTTQSRVLDRVFQHSIIDGMGLIRALDLPRSQIFNIFISATKLKHPDLLSKVDRRAYSLIKSNSSTRHNLTIEDLLQKLAGARVSATTQDPEYLRKYGKRMTEEASDLIDEIDNYYAELLRLRKFAPIERKSDDRSPGVRQAEAVLHQAEEILEGSYLTGEVRRILTEGIDLRFFEEGYDLEEYFNNTAKHSEAPSYYREVVYKLFHSSRISQTELIDLIKLTIDPDQMQDALDKLEAARYRPQDFATKNKLASARSELKAEINQQLDELGIEGEVSRTEEGWEVVKEKSEEDGTEQIQDAGEDLDIGNFQYREAKKTPNASLTTFGETAVIFENRTINILGVKVYPKLRKESDIRFSRRGEEIIGITESNIQGQVFTESIKLRPDFDIPLSKGEAIEKVFRIGGRSYAIVSGEVPKIINQDGEATYVPEGLFSLKTSSLDRGVSLSQNELILYDTRADYDVRNHRYYYVNFKNSNVEFHDTIQKYSHVEILKGPNNIPLIVGRTMDNTFIEYNSNVFELHNDVDEVCVSSTGTIVALGKDDRGSFRYYPLENNEPLESKKRYADWHFRLDDNVYAYKSRDLTTVVNLDQPGQIRLTPGEKLKSAISFEGGTFIHSETDNEVNVLRVNDRVISTISSFGNLQKINNGGFVWLDSIAVGEIDPEIANVRYWRPGFSKFETLVIPADFYPITNLRATEDYILIISDQDDVVKQYSLRLNDAKNEKTEDVVTDLRVMERLELLQLLDMIDDSEVEPDPEKIREYFAGQETEPQTFNQRMRNWLGQSQSHVDNFNEIVSEEPELFLDTMAAESGNLSDYAIDKIVYQLFPELQQTAGGNTGNWARDYTPSAESYFTNIENGGLRGGDPKQESIEVMRTRESINEMIATDILGGYNAESGQWERVSLSVHQELADPVHEYTFALPAVLPGSEVVLPNLVGAVVIPNRVHGITKDGEEILLDSTQTVLGRILIRVPQGVSSIKYSVQKTELPIVPNDISHHEFDKFRTRLDSITEVKLTQQLPGLPASLKTFVEVDLADMTPFEKLVAIEQKVREIGFYDMEEGEVSSLKQNAKAEDMFQIMADRMSELQSRNSEIPSGKVFAGVCADFALLTSALLRSAGLPAGVINGFRPQGQSVNSQTFHRSSFVAWPVQGSDRVRIISVDGTPSAGLGELAELIQQPSITQKVQEKQNQETRIIEQAEQKLAEALEVLEQNDLRAIERLTNGRLESLVNTLLQHAVKTSHFNTIQTLLNASRYSQLSLNRLDLDLTPDRAELKAFLQTEIARVKEKTIDNRPSGKEFMETIQDFARRYEADGHSKQEAYSKLKQLFEIARPYLDEVEAKTSLAVVQYLSAKELG